MISPLSLSPFIFLSLFSRHLLLDHHPPHRTSSTCRTEAVPGEVTFHNRAARREMLYDDGDDDEGDDDEEEEEEEEEEKQEDDSGKTIARIEEPSARMRKRTARQVDLKRNFTFNPRMNVEVDYL